MHRHGMAKRQTLCGFFERHDHLIAAFIKEMQVIPLYAVNLIPYGVQYGMCYFAANQWRALVQQHGAVFCLQQLRAGGSEALVGSLIDFLTTSIIKSQTNVGLALALKTSACLRHHCVERARAAKSIEPMQAGVRALANCQFDANGGQFSHEIGIQERRGRDAMPEIADGRELRVVTGKNHLGTSQRNLGNHVKQGNLAHKAFVKAQRALEVSFLDPVLETGQGFPGIELPTRNVRTGTAGHTLQLLQTTLHEMRLADTRWPVQKETPLFTSELQGQLLDIGFVFTENLDSWEKVGWGPDTLVEDDAFLLLGGQGTGEDAKHFTLATGPLHKARTVERQPAAWSVQRFTCGIQQGALGLLRYVSRGL